MSKKKQLKKLKKAYRRAMEQGTEGRELPAVENGGGYGAGPVNAGLLRSLGLSGFGSRQTEQFLLGALIGAAATYVLTDEALRGKIVRMAMKLYGGVAGGFEEFKEQMADLKAEIEAEHGGEA